MLLKPSARVVASLHSRLSGRATANAASGPACGDMGSVCRSGTVTARIGRPRPGRADDRGAATIEFVFLSVLIMVPLVYLVIAVFDVQRNTFAVTQAAREAGRAFATAGDVDSGEARARYAMRLALEDQGLDTSRTELRFGPVGSGCRGTDAQTLQPGADFEVCVVREFRVPGIPTYFDGGNNTVTGRFVVHIDDFRGSR